MLKPKFLPAILISLAKKYSVSLIAKCRAKFCRGRCPDQLCKVPNLLSCCNLAVLPCKIGIGAPIPRFSGRLTIQNKQDTDIYSVLIQVTPSQGIT
uniref:Uncharacterized protein n=1 Tax=Rhizophagus irregularis (strain DAOM 181602 / DAOM 197198 / MUCL 43194) TaxID=747089 RepID=U9UUG9_RHIID